MRYVVMKDRSLGDPMYVAENEPDASMYLNGLATRLRKEGYIVERHNSMTMIARRGNDWQTYYVRATPSWDDEPEQQAGNDIETK